LRSERNLRKVSVGRHGIQEGDVHLQDAYQVVAVVHVHLACHHPVHEEVYFGHLHRLYPAQQVRFVVRFLCRSGFWLFRKGLRFDDGSGFRLFPMQGLELVYLCRELLHPGVGDSGLVGHVGDPGLQS